MLTPELQKNIDEKWNACWPLSTLRPIVILDLISYLFFFKKISGHILVSENSENKLNPVFTNSNSKELATWSTFKTLDEQNMHIVFTSENGVIDLVKKYHKNSAYDIFLKGNLLLTPTPKLLFNAAAIIRLTEDKDADTKGSIFEYLLNKSEVNEQNGQTFLPGYLAELMVSIIQPREKDWILDPSAGNGSLLVNCIKYISKKNPEFSRNLINNFDSGRFVGIESDLTNLRIAAMNMILHGIPNPELKLLNASSSLSSITTEQPTAFIANLIFSAGENKTASEGTSVREATRKEVFHLNFILKNCKVGARVAVIVPDAILYNTVAEIITIRQEIIDNFKLEGVISLNDKTSPQFFGASILIFSKEASAITDKVWFYEMESKEKSNKENTGAENWIPNNTKNISEQTGETAGIISQFRNKNSSEENKNSNFFYINANDIRSRNYNLSFNEYSLFIQQEIPATPTESASGERKIIINKIKNQPLFPAAEKIPDPPKRYAKKIIIISSLSILVLGITFLTYWIFYLKKDIPFLNRPAAISAKAIDSTTVAPAINAINNTQSKDSTNSTATKYLVISKAYFYTTPDSNSRRDVYINRFVNAILTPTDEKNGFVYVEYVNKRGETTKGWLNKKNLRKVP